MRTKNRIVLWMLVLGWMVGCADVEFQEKPAPEGETNRPVCLNCNTDPTYERYLLEVLVPEANDKVDILFVVDNSLSMRVEQQSLSSKFPSFISSLNGVDYRIGFITTDNHNLITIKDRYGNSTGDKWIDSSTSDASGKFQRTVQVGENGNGDERGIYRAYQALKGGDNPGFLRSNATLAVVVVSDEDERSVGRRAGTSGTDDNGERFDFTNFQSYEKYDYADNFIKAIDVAKKLSVHSIIVPSPNQPAYWEDPNCEAKQSNQGLRAYVGAEYERASELTGGAVGTVCANDYGSQLGQIGEVINETRESVSLGCVPSIDPSEGREFEVTPASMIDFVELDGDKVYFNPPLQSGDGLTITYWCRS